MGIMYGNLGYAFDGWFEKDENGYYTTAYTVGQGLIINENLKLYAKWNANVYFVIFNANVPPETTYSGTMENAQYAYNTQYYLPINTYQRKGYFFEGWALSATAEEVKYADGARIVNLANSAGEEVILYAVWRKCLHGTLEYSVSGNVMTRYCNCLAFSETATVKANNCVYDGASHAATVVYSGAAWANSSLEHVYKKYGETEYVATGTVINAGYYTATFKHNEISLSISFEIEKANQKAPAKPTYTTTDDAVNHTITISPASDEVLGTEQRYEYRIGYLSNDKTLYQYNTNPQDNVFYLSISLTNYFAYIRFAETDNYKASEYTRADAVYFFSGNVSIKVIESEGLSGEAKEAQQGDDFIGITALCSLKEGYYNFNFGIDTTQSQLCGATYNIEGLNIHIYDIPENSALVIYLVGAKREVKVDSYIEAGEVFGKPEKTSEIKIANDSSYTVYFGIQNYALYDGLSLSFNQALPENTSIILIDKTQEQYTYWYYLFGEESSSVSLLDFIAMQSDTTISTSGESLQYQFIVDFSNCEADLLENALTVRLTATPQSGVPAFPNSNCSIKLYKVTSKVEKIAGTVANETNNLTVAYAQMDEENISASKWENRQATLVLEPENVATLPLDLAVEIVERTQTTLYYRTGNYFIMPLNMAENSLENVSLTLKSKLFPEEGATYNFTGALYVSNSNAGKAPMNTVPIQSGISMSFTVPKTEMPSLKITGRIRHCTVDGSLTVFVAGEIPDGFDLTADVMKKEENKEGNSKVYSSTGIWPNVTVNANLTVDFANLNMEEGSYCLLLTVKEHNTGLIKLQVPYYFIIYGHSQKTQ